MIALVICGNATRPQVLPIALDFEEPAITHYGLEGEFIYLVNRVIE